jgi:hypothetical protein
MACQKELRCRFYSVAGPAPAARSHGDCSAASFFGAPSVVLVNYDKIDKLGVGAHRSIAIPTISNGASRVTFGLAGCIIVTSGVQPDRPQSSPQLPSGKALPILMARREEITRSATGSAAFLYLLRSNGHSRTTSWFGGFMCRPSTFVTGIYEKHTPSRAARDQSLSAAHASGLLPCASFDSTTPCGVRFFQCSTSNLACWCHFREHRKGAQQIVPLTQAEFSRPVRGFRSGEIAKIYQPAPWSNRIQSQITPCARLNVPSNRWPQLAMRNN